MKSARTLETVLAAPLFALVLAAPAAAHMGKTKTLRVTPNETGAALSVEVPTIDIGVGLGLGTAPDPAALTAAAPTVFDALSSQLDLRDDTGVCVLRADRLAVDGDRVVLSINGRCPGEGALTVTDTSLGSNPGHQTTLVVQRGGERAVHILRASQPSLHIAATPSVASTALRFTREGVIHLVTGYDHVLFLLSLILGLGVLTRKRGTRAALTNLGKTVTAFTVGHSVTLALAALELVSLPIALVEATIALSITAVALLNIFAPEKHGTRPGIALVFGLVHGFGFSSVLADVGLPTGDTVLALLAFNVGIELAQLAFVAAVLIPLTAFANRRWYRPVVVYAGSFAVGVMGLVWFAERIPGVF